MSQAPHLPVLVGVGQVTNRAEEAGAGREPLDLAERALRAAAHDTGAADAILSRLDGLDVVNVVSWQYDGLPRRLADRVGASPSRAEHSEWGGNMPTLLLDRAAARIARRESRVEAVVGAEAFRSLELAMRAGAMPDWTPPPPGAAPPNPRDHVPAAAFEHGLVMPSDVYPLYENALRARLGRSFADNQSWSARLWADMSEVAAGNPGSWDPTIRTAEEIATVGPRNRMVGFPYPKLMNARMSVDQAAAAILVDAEVADELGIPPERRVHPVAGAGANDPHDVLRRVAYDRAPAMELALHDALEAADTATDHVDRWELYSCFPCVPKLALTALGLPDDHAITVTGGLTAFGGPGNDYMLHAVVAMVEALRDGAGGTGLLYGNGGFVTKHHALVVSREAPGHYPTDGPAADEDRQRRVDKLNAPEVTVRPDGRATIETYTVTHGHDGARTGIVVGRLDHDGPRFVAHVPDEQVDRLTDPRAQPVGAVGTAATDTNGHATFTLA